MKPTDRNATDSPASPGDAGREQQYERFVTLMASSERSIRAYLRGLLPCWEDVDEVMQEVSLVCWRKFSQLDSPQGFIPWACVIGRNEVLRYRRRIARDRLVFSEELLEMLSSEATEDLQRSEQERSALQHCLKQLAAGERELVMAVHSPGTSVADLARKSGVNAKRLYKRVGVLRELLMDCVTGRMATESV